MIVMAFGFAVGFIMLSMFYGQYRWLADQILTTSESEHQVFLEASYGAAPNCMQSLTAW